MDLAPVYDYKRGGLRCFGCVRRMNGDDFMKRMREKLWRGTTKNEWDDWVWGKGCEGEATMMRMNKNDCEWREPPRMNEEEHERVGKGIKGRPPWWELKRMTEENEGECFKQGYLVKWTYRVDEYFIYLFFTVKESAQGYKQGRKKNIEVHKQKWLRSLASLCVSSQWFPDSHGPNYAPH